MQGQSSGILSMAGGLGYHNLLYIAMWLISFGKDELRALVILPSSEQYVLIEQIPGSFSCEQDTQLLLALMRVKTHP